MLAVEVLVAELEVLAAEVLAAEVLAAEVLGLRVFTSITDSKLLIMLGGRRVLSRVNKVIEYLV